MAIMNSPFYSRFMPVVRKSPISPILHSQMTTNSQYHHRGVSMASSGFDRGRRGSKTPSDVGSCLVAIVVLFSLLPAHKRPIPLHA